MSEPIFRAWDNKNKRWLTDFLINKTGVVYADDVTELKQWYPVDATLCLSTGLKDRNGKMIFEFDIIQSGIYRLIVQFRDGSFVVKIYNSLETYVSLSKYYLNLNQFEKIGSSLANPELLEQKQNG